MVNEQGKEINYSIRMPPELHSELKQIAKEEGRSLHAQILRALREFATAWRQEHER